MSQLDSRPMTFLPEAMKPARVFIALIAIAAIGLLGGSSVWLGHPASAQTNTAVDYDADDDGLIEITSAAQLDAVRYDLDGDGSSTNSTPYDAAFPNAATGMGCPSTGCTGYELTTNLDFDTNGNGEADAGDTYWNGGAGWEPIGQENNEYGAIFEGNNHIIANLHISRNLSGMGLFGYTSTQSDIKRIGLVGVNVTGRWNSGGLVGVNRGTITGSYVSGGESSITGVYSVGGLAGYNTGTITGSYATSDVNGQGEVGGLVGKNGGPISASYSTGDVTGIGSGQVWRVGGLVGGWDGPAVDQPISASFATGDVTGYAAVGGLVGGMRQPIVNSYATGDVTGDRKVGGLVGGTSAFSPTITNSYSTGTVTGNSETGGMVGYNFASGLQTTASYWNTETSGQSTSAGGEGKTTSELQSPTSNAGIYATWDDDVWDFGTSSEYPELSTSGSSGSSAQATPSPTPTATPTPTSTPTPTPTPTPTSTPTPTPTPTPTSTPTPTPTPMAAQSSGDYDADDDGLIEIMSAAQLNAIRWDLDGDGAPASANASDYAAAFTNAAAGMGCPQAGCTGYELDTDIDLNVAPYYTGAGWEPIGTDESRFRTTFEGNGNTISNLFINRPTADHVGLFGSSVGVIRNVGLTGESVTGGGNVGGLVGTNHGTITASYTTGAPPTWDFWGGGSSKATVGNKVGGLAGNNTGTIIASYSTTFFLVGVNSANNPIHSIEVGGLVGSNRGTITASWATGLASDFQTESSVNSYVGGLVGANHQQGGTITASYATGSAAGRGAVGGLVGSNLGPITASYATGSVSHSFPIPPHRTAVYALGGLVGDNSNGPITVSYWDTQTSGQSASNGGQGKTTSELQSPTGYSGIYANWNVDLDGGDDDDDPWDFGTSSEYPVIDVDAILTAIATPMAAHSSACATEGAVTDATNAGLVSDCDTLLAARDTLAGTATLNWSAHTPIADWDGIGDDSLEGSPTRVTRLYLNRLRLDGMIPSGLSNLSELRVLYLHDNELTGTIPSSLGDLSNLTDLYAHNNDLTGEIPAELGELASLQELSLYSNDLSGSIPSEMGKLTSLTNLSLHDNDLTGEIPAGIGKLSSLESLDIAENNLTGSIPAELGKLTNLVGLGLSDNDLEGEIPLEISGLAKLQELYLYRNKLTGQIPDELGQLLELTDLWLNSNYLSEQIPRSLGGLTKLTSLRLADNSFTGCLPEGLAAVSDSDADQLGLATCGSVTGVAVSSRPAEGDTYALGETIRIRVTFSDAVSVTGSPRLKIDMDPADWGEKWAHYESGSGTSALTFAHQVVEPNFSTQGIAVLANTLELNGGAIKSTATQEDADLSHTGLPHDPAHKVDWR